MKDEEILEILVAKDNEILMLRRAIKSLKKGWKADLKDAQAEIKELEREVSQRRAINSQLVGDLQRERERRDSDKAVLIDRAVTAERRAGITVLPDKDGNPDVNSVVDRPEPEQNANRWAVNANRQPVEFYSREHTPPHATGGTGRY
jgi:hypothetical protein